MTKHRIFEDAEVCQPLGVTVLYGTGLRIPKEQRHDDLFYYEIRDSDDGFEPCELKKSIMVNHFGTIATDKPIPELEEGGSIDILTEGEEGYDEDPDNVLHDYHVFEWI